MYWICSCHGKDFADLECNYVEQETLFFDCWWLSRDGTLPSRSQGPSAAGAGSMAVVDGLLAEPVVPLPECQFWMLRICPQDACLCLVYCTGPILWVFPLVAATVETVSWVRQESEPRTVTSCLEDCLQATLQCFLRTASSELS